MPRLDLEVGAHLPDIDLHIERRGGRYTIRKQFAPEIKPRPAKHRHGYGENQMPVLGFDLHQTITPDLGYPLPAPPFDGFKEGADAFAARGCCLHVCTASLELTDPDIYDARVAMLWQYFRQYGLPINWIGPNSEAALRIDDRGVNVPANPDWSVLWGQAEKKLAKVWELDKNGRYRERDDLNPVGTLIADDEYPSDDDVPPDAPRGFSSQIIDIDMHRTLMPAWGTRRDAKPNPDGVACLREWYSAGYTIQISCAGWNPALVDPDFSKDRSAWQRRYLRQWGIPYDRLVAKDDQDVWFDDKTVNYAGNWSDMDAAVQALGPPFYGPTRIAGVPRSARS